MNGYFKKARIWMAAVPCALFLAAVYCSYARLAAGPQVQLTPPAPVVERGSIVDRNGKPLAVQTYFYHFGVTPKLIKDADAFARDVAPVLGMAEWEVSGPVSRNPEGNFVYIKKKLTQEQYDELYKVVDERGYTNFTRFDRIPGRVYPLNDLASQLIGYMGGDEGRGLSGMEFSEQQVLSPDPPEGSTGTVYGKNIFLTIDANLQYKLEKIAKDTMAQTQAESMMMIAADAKTGELLSYISLPAADLNNYSAATPAEQHDSPAIDQYEPGSVFKIFTASAYVDSGVVTPETQLYTTGVYRRVTNLGEVIEIKCNDPHPHGRGTVREALEYSCNDAFAQMSDMLGPEEFIAYLRRFGFGERTGVELPSESPGRLKTPDDRTWSARTKATISIGQEISVSALQMVQAALALANRGVPPKLTFIQRITDKDGKDEYVHSPEYRERVIKASTAEYILSCMQSTAENGTGWRALLGDISIGVKTGTAQIAENGRYLDDQYISSCLGIFPVEEPRIVLYTVIVKAQGENLGGRIAAPVIRLAADEIIDHLGMTRDKAPTLEHSGRFSVQENAPITLGAYLPDFTGRPKRDLVPLVEERTDVNLSIQGEGWVVRQSPEPGTPVTENMTIELFLEY